MSDSSASESQSLKTLFITGFVLAAAAGGWALGRMGAERDHAKAEAENAVTTGTGTVKEASSAVLPAPVEAKPAETPAAKLAAKEPEPVTPAEPPVVPEEVVPVGPPKLILHSIPAAGITLRNNTGFSKNYVTDARGDFRSETLPEGVYEIAVNHRDYKPLATPVVFELKAGETTETTARPEPRPASLVVVADAGSTVFLDGAKVGGGGAVMLGSVASRRPLALKIVPASGNPRTETLTLDPRESRLFDVRTPEGIARAKAEAEAEAAAANAPAVPKTSVADAARLAAIAEKTSGTETPVAPTVPAVPAAPVSLAVKIISADAGSKLVAFTGPVSGVAPMPPGKAGALRFSDTGESTLVIKCVRTFGGVSVCEAAGIPAIATPADGVATF